MHQCNITIPSQKKDSYPVLSLYSHDARKTKRSGDLSSGDPIGPAETTADEGQHESRRGRIGAQSRCEPIYPCSSRGRLSLANLKMRAWKGGKDKSRRAKERQY